jgi:hypothetical protein
MKKKTKVVSPETSEGGSGNFGESLASGANDIVVVRQSNGELAATPVHLQIGESAKISKLDRFRLPGKIIYNT